MLAADAFARPRRARLDERMDERVLDLDVVGAEVGQRPHGRERPGHFGHVRRVGGADANERVGHGGAQRLVDVAIEVESRMGGGRAVLERALGEHDLHTFP